MAKRKKSLRRGKTSTSNKRAPDVLSRSALRLIDQAAELLKDGVIAGAKQGAKGHQALKKKAFSLVNLATRRLNKAVHEGSATLRKGLRKI